MKVAVISDIHGNIYSLMRVLDDIDSQKVDKIICLGDLVGYGPHPNEVVALIRRRDLPCVKGNYDASVVDGDFTFIRNNQVNSFALPWAVEETRMSNKMFLDNLPTDLTFEFDGVKFKFLHGSPNAINEYLFENNENLEEITSNLEEDVLICAHTHIPYEKTINEKTIINVGSVGKPKIGRPNATYVIIDTSNGSVKNKVKEIEYDVHKIVKDMQILHFPQGLIDSYINGSE